MQGDSQSVTVTATRTNNVGESEPSAPVAIVFKRCETRIPPNSEVKLVLVGDSQVGKTCMAVSFTTNAFPVRTQHLNPEHPFSPLTSTLIRRKTFLRFSTTTRGIFSSTVKKMSMCISGIRLEWRTTIGDGVVFAVLQFLMVSLTFPYGRLRPLSYPQTDVFLLCFSLVDMESLNHVRSKWHPEIAHHMAQHNEQAPWILVGLKQDLLDDRRRVVDDDEADVSAAARSLAAELGASAYSEVSALTQHGLRQCFQSAAEAKFVVEVEPARKRWW